MRLSYMSLVTAILCFAGAIVWLALGYTVSGLIWLAISIVWLVIAIVHRTKPEAMEPHPGRQLFRRFSRLILFWT